MTYNGLAVRDGDQDPPHPDLNPGPYMPTRQVPFTNKLLDTYTNNDPPA